MGLKFKVKFTLNEIVMCFFSVDVREQMRGTNKSDVTDKWEQDSNVSA